MPAEPDRPKSGDQAVSAAKRELRVRLSSRRRAMSEADRAAARDVIRTTVLHWCSDTDPGPGGVVAAYDPMPTEPGSIELLNELTHSGIEVLVPITLRDNDLDWARWTLTRRAALPLGIDAIGRAGLVLVPAFAVDSAGNRLGRGGGSYDRALARMGPTAVSCATLFDGELVEAVPHDVWDRPVQAVVTPSGWQMLSPESTARTGRRNTP